MRREAALSPDLLGRGRHGETPFLHLPPARFSGLLSANATRGRRFNRPLKRARRRTERGGARRYLGLKAEAKPRFAGGRPVKRASTAPTFSLCHLLALPKNVGKDKA